MVLARCTKKRAFLGKRKKKFNKRNLDISLNVLDLSVVSCVPIVFLLILGSFSYSPSLSWPLTLHPDKVNRSQRTTRHFSRGDIKLNAIYSREGGGMGKGQLPKTIWIRSQSHSLMPLLRTQATH